MVDEQIPAPPPPPTPPPPPATAGPSVFETDAGAVDGLVKCVRCGSTEIGLNVATGMLRCGFCRFEWAGASAADAFDLNGDVALLDGVRIGSGSTDITPTTDVIVTFKCGACGAEVQVDTEHSTQARCHWCRNTLSMNQQIPNGAVPDALLPFSVPKATAVASIKAFVGKRKFFAHPQFIREFNAENVMGVYLPYMVVDVKAHAVLAGQGEHQTRSYTVRQGDRSVRRYDADVYQVVREFDLHVRDLTVESSSERQDQNALENSNNIINTIMPFDVENALRFDANYLSGFTSERRDTNLDELMPIAHAQTEDIARFRAQETLGHYDRGVRWDSQQVQLVGQRWVSVYLPVWLYSYRQDKGGGESFLHYVAVNGRTGETMGSVPINKLRLLAVSTLVEIGGIAAFAVAQVLR